MKSTMIFTLLTALFALTMARPFSLNDIFPGFISNTKLVGPAKHEQHAKRHAVQANPDAELKQISLQGLIGDLEDSLFQSALSVNRAHEEGSVVEEITPPTDAATAVNHSIYKREHTATTIAGDLDAITATSTEATTDEAEHKKNVLLQTTKKVVESEGVPAHILIDHISVQPHNGNTVPLVPTFQVHHTKVTSVKEDKSNENSDAKTKISITKTSITSTGVENVENADAANAKPQLPGDLTIGVPGKFTLSIPGLTLNNESTTTTTDATTNSTTTNESTSDATTTVSPTTEKSETSTSTTTKEPLKEAEEKLKEKVAEIEADPVILSARV